MLEKNADVNCCFLCSVIFIEYYSTMHCNEVLQACQVDPIYCDIFGAAERVLRYGLPINLRYIFKRVPALFVIQIIIFVLYYMFCLCQYCPHKSYFARFSSSGINICCTSPLVDLRKLYTVSLDKTSNISTFSQVE